ncbi:MAG: toxin-antitoxin system TumE family protein [Candidatus Binatia bacterium]
MAQARRLLHLKDYLPGGLLREIRLYEVPVSRTYAEGIKYSCYLGDPETGQKIIGYDTHPGKGHHRHVRGQETRYEFHGLETLLDDFARDVQEVLEGKL